MDVVNALAETWPRRAPLRRAFAEVAQEHLDDVYRYLVFLTADPVLAEDLTGETFEKAFRSWKRFDPRRGLGAHVALPARTLEGARPFPLGVEAAKARGPLHVADSPGRRANCRRDLGGARGSSAFADRGRA
jgi:Sigma-70 region 2